MGSSAPGAAVVAASRASPSVVTLLLLAHEAGLPRGVYVVALIDARRPQRIELSHPFEAPMLLADPYYPANFRSVEDFDGRRWVRLEAPEGAATPLRLVVRERRGRDLVEVASFEAERAAYPHVLRVVRDHVYVGTMDTVFSADLSAPAPALRALVTRDLGPRKSYDLIVFTADRLLAIDDVVDPRIADWFALDARGAGVSRGFVLLPEGTNLAYYAATLTGGSVPGQATLHALATGGGRGCDFHHVCTATLDDDHVCTNFEGAFQRCHVDGPGLGESVNFHSERRSEQASYRVLAGERLTWWWSLVRDQAAHRTLVAAGSRGVLVFRDELPATEAPELLALGGECRDVATAQGLAFALCTHDAVSELVVLRRGDGRYDELTRHTLPGRVVDIVDGAGFGGDTHSPPFSPYAR